MNQVKERRDDAAEAPVVQPPPPDATSVSAEAGSAAYSVSLPTFEGPLDLLLHLCQKHELNILDIPIGFITEKYLEYLAVMTLMNLDVASEYLVMAATLAHIKSKMLLPAPPPGQEDEIEGEEEDPREALIRRLLEYQKYKKAAEDLAARGVAGRDIFMRGMPIDEAVHTGLPPLAQVPLFSLVEAFQNVLAKSKVKISHDIVHEGITLADRINELVDVLRVKRRIVFEDLFKEVSTRFELVITFLALLEMTRLRMTRLYQENFESGIYIEFTASVTGDDDPSIAEAAAQAEASFEPPKEAGGAAPAPEEKEEHAKPKENAEAETASSDRAAETSASEETGAGADAYQPEGVNDTIPPAGATPDLPLSVESLPDEDELAKEELLRSAFDTEPPPSAILADDAMSAASETNDTNEAVAAASPVVEEIVIDAATIANAEPATGQTIPCPPPAESDAPPAEASVPELTHEATHGEATGAHAAPPVDVAEADAGLVEPAVAEPAPEPAPIEAPIEARVEAPIETPSSDVTNEATVKTTTEDVATASNDKHEEPTNKDGSIVDVERLEDPK